MIVNEILFYLHESRPPGLILKADFKKAFDSINWSFILQCLKVHGIPPVWITWVESVLSSSHSAVLVNGEGGHFFKVHRGLKQGCPLSPFLFILAVDTLGDLLRYNVALEEIQGISPCGIWNIHHLQFADDTIICIKPSTAAIHRLWDIPAGFSLA